jgi:hypothetical protein
VTFSADTLAVLAVLYALECDPKTAGHRHVTGYLWIRAEVAPYLADRAVKELAEVGIIERDQGSLGLPAIRSQWRMRDLDAARYALEHPDGEELTAIASLLGA